MMPSLRSCSVNIMIKATSMPKIARQLRACNPDNPEEQKVFFRFKNFLYKTIRIS